MNYRNRISYFLLAFLWIGNNAPLQAANCTLITDAAARACCDRNLSEQSMRQEIRLAVIDDKGTVNDIEAKLSWKRFEDGQARARVDITAPSRQAGTIVLLTEREADEGDEPPEPEVVIYKPSERRDRLLSVSALSGEMFGTDFSYEDFAYFYGTDTEVDIVRLADETLDGRELVVLKSTPKDFDAAFDRGSISTRIVTRFDADQCVPISTQFFEEGDELRKELTATPEHIRQLEQRWIPHEMVMHDLAEQSKTALTIESIEFDPEMKNGIFSRSSLKRGR
jgi:hypothetical protein